MNGFAFIEAQVDLRRFWKTAILATQSAESQYGFRAPLPVARVFKNFLKLDEARFLIHEPSLTCH